jgi:DNA repair exonuclease SbcCD nuclease subunit
MRICHVSDSHLGAGEGHARRGASGLTLRQEDIINSFVAAVDEIIRLKPDVCIHSGDLFHVVRPLNRIMAIAGEQLHRLASEAGIPTVIISGNHDAPKQPHIGAALEVYKHIDNLFISSGTRLQTFDIADTRFFALPHCLTTQIQKDELTKCLPDSSKRHNVLIMHGVAAGMPEFSMADLGEQELPIDIMESFDYTALGHFHNYCKVAERSFYAGSTERLSQSERESPKGFVEVILQPFSVNFHEVQCRQMVDLTPIDARGQRGDELAALLKDKLSEVDSSDKIVRVKVSGVTEETLKTIPADVIADLKQKSFALDISFEKQKNGQESTGFGRSAIGRLDSEFLRFLETIDLKGFDSDKLRQMALTYLSEED